MRGAGVWNPGPLCVPREFLLCNQMMTGVRGEAAGCPRGMGLQLGLVVERLGVQVAGGADFSRRQRPAPRDARRGGGWDCWCRRAG